MKPKLKWTQIVAIACIALFGIIFICCNKKSASSDRETERSDSDSSIPTSVITPPASAEGTKSATNIVDILVDVNGRVFLKINNISDQESRKEMLSKALELYNNQHPSKKIALTEKQIQTLCESNIIGLSFSQLPEWLDLAGDPKTIQQSDEWLAGQLKGKQIGIPYDEGENPDNPNEFQIWLLAMASISDPAIHTALKDGEGISVKVDKDTEYRIFQQVTENLKTIKMNKFSLTEIKDND